MVWPWQFVTDGHTVTLTSPLAPWQCMLQLQGVTSPIGWIPAINKRFVGTVTMATFRVRPRFLSTAMLVVGALIPDADGTIVIYQTTIDPGILLQLAVGLLGLLYSGGLRLGDRLGWLAFMNHSDGASFFLYGGAVLGIGGTIGLISFLRNRTQAEQDLRAYLQTQLVSQ